MEEKNKNDYLRNGSSRGESMLSQILETLETCNLSTDDVQNLLIAADNLLSSDDLGDCRKATYSKLTYIAEETYIKAFKNKDYSHPILVALAIEFKKKAGKYEMPTSSDLS